MDGAEGWAASLRLGASADQATQRKTEPIEVRRRAPGGGGDQD